MFNTLNPLAENKNTVLGIFIMLCGFVFMALGMAIYMKSEQGCGPRDALLVGLGKRMPRLPIGLVEILLWAVVPVFGWLLGGPIGIGTLIGTVGAGFVMQLVYGVIRFEPRKLKHRDVREITTILFASPSSKEA